MTDPPNEAGGTGNAPHENLPLPKSLLSPQEKVNRAQFAVWEDEAQRLLREFLVTRNRKHFDAFATHVSGMRAQLPGRSTP